MKITRAIKNVALRTAKRLKCEYGGVSPMVVTIGLALLLLVILAAINPTISNGVSTAVNTVMARLQSF